MIKPNEKPPVETEKLIQSVLTLNGLKRGKDFVLKRNQLRIFSGNIKPKVLSLIRENCPELSLYWETSYVLRWF